MVLFLYNIFIRIYATGIRIASLWNSKAKDWIKGRENLFASIEKKIDPDQPVVWIHCASAGEFEQGKPVIEVLKTEYPRHQIIVSFFSPSGYNTAKTYPGIITTYLPSDTRKNARRFINCIHPDLVIFVKYEFWYHHIAVAAFNHIPVILISGIFRKSQVFFRWYGNFFTQMLFLFRRIFVQDKMSLQLLQEKYINHVSNAGDTRFDRVVKLIESPEPIPPVQKFINNTRCIVAGSTWKEDEVALQYTLQFLPSDISLIIAPHEIHNQHLDDIRKLFPDAVFYSELPGSNTSDNQPRILIIDNFGMLSRLYHYGTLTYVGGGFNQSGIHNTLEAAVYGKPVFFGPHYTKFREARELIGAGGAFSYSKKEDLKNKMIELLKNDEKLKSAGMASEKYVRENTGSTTIIMNYIQENRLLTS
ncbi:MAG: 3-deoxy-D-manno-octulosonic acid transferase [Flavisolibacter sp.]